MNKENEAVYTASGITSAGAIYESVMNEDRPAFLVWSGSELTLVEHLEEDGKLMLPLRKGMFPYEPYAITEDELCGFIFDANYEDIFRCSLREFHTFLDLNSKYKFLEVAQTFETYQCHKVNTTSYLYHLGSYESGKTRALEVHQGLDYRPILSSDLPVADVYHYLGRHGEAGATILEDEAQSLNGNINKMRIYRQGYRRGAVVPRILDGGTKKSEQIFYESFCCKVFAGIALPYDRGFRLRCIPIPMAQGQPNKDEVDEEDRERWNQIRLNLLVYLRMQNYTVPLPTVDVGELRNRLKELWKPKLRILQGIVKHPLRRLALEERTKKIEETKYSLEAQVCRAVIQACSYHGTGTTEVPFSAIWRELVALLFAKEKGNTSMYSDSYGTVTKHWVGTQLTNNFGADKKTVRLSEGLAKCYSFDERRLEQMREKYFVEERVVRDLFEEESDTMEHK